MLTNAILVHLTGFGLVAKIGREGVDELLLLALDGDERVPELAQAYIRTLAEQLVLIKRRILEIDRHIPA